MQTLFIVYDGRCGLCTQLKSWIGKQRAYVPVRLIASGSDEARLRFPELPDGELAAVSDSGDLWLGNSAWIVCLWALREYRAWARRLASPLLLPFARQGFAAVSRHKGVLSSLLGFKADAPIRECLRGLPIPPCEINPRPIHQK